MLKSAQLRARASLCRKWAETAPTKLRRVKLLAFAIQLENLAQEARAEPSGKQTS
jgi:hypothetical protein